MNAFNLEELGMDSRVIGNQRILATIFSNDQTMIAMDREYGTIQAYLRTPADFAASLDTLLKDLEFMGPTGIYYFLWVVGKEVPPHEEFGAAYPKNRSPR